MKDFHSGTEGLICQKNCEGWLVGVWEGLNLGSIPNDHMPSQKDRKSSIERSYSTILPRIHKKLVIRYASAREVEKLCEMLEKESARN